MMSEDEFVVLVEHAGLVDSFDESDVEFIERYQLLEWLDREGFELFRQRMNGTNDFRLFHNEVEEPVAELMVLYLLERKWISAVETEQIDEATYLQYYALRLSTTEAYRIYLEKDLSVVNTNIINSPVLDITVTDTTAVPPHSSKVKHGECSDTTTLRIRERLWNECFPTGSDVCRQLYFSFESPQVIIYATLGLNLIDRGLSSVPSFSRELKILGISHQDRTVIVGFLARAFPT